MMNRSFRRASGLNPRRSERATTSVTERAPSEYMTLCKRVCQTNILGGCVVQMGGKSQEPPAWLRPHHDHHFDLEPVVEHRLQWIVCERLSLRLMSTIG